MILFSMFDRKNVKNILTILDSCEHFCFDHQPSSENRDKVAVFVIVGCHALISLLNLFKIKI